MLERAEPRGFDFLPVRDRQSGSIIGLLHTQSIKALGLSVGEAMEPLSGAILIGADAPLLHFVCEADRTPCRLVLDDASISGIVTLSDIQRLPVRTALFSLFIHLEMMLTRTLRELDPHLDPIERLPEKARKRALRWWNRASNDRIQRDQWSVLEFADKRDLAVAHPAFAEAKDRLYADFTFIQVNLRNPIAHANEWALTREEACNVAVAARLLRDWTIWFREWRRGQGPAVPLVSASP